MRDLIGQRIDYMAVRQSDIAAPVSQTAANLLHCWSAGWGSLNINSITCTQGGQHKKSSPRCGSFVTLMIIYNSQVACLCGPHSATARRLRLPCIFGKQYQMASKQKKKKKKRVWIRRDLYKCRIISDDIALTNTVPHHYVCLPRRLPARHCATNIDRWLCLWFDY